MISTSKALPFFKSEAYAPLIIDANAPLPFATQFNKTGWREVVKAGAFISSVGFLPQKNPYVY
jgi:hypothetical protein